jgi:RNA polymerase sigma-70 factor, ECF subfamily
MTVGLVERARDGDHAAFTELIAVDGDRCYAIAYRILRDTERAQDAVQVAYLQAWRGLRDLRDPERFGVWLYRLLVNACYEESRRHRRWNVHAERSRSMDRVSRIPRSPSTTETRWIAHSSA